MTEEQRNARKNSAESGHIRWIKDNCLRTKDGDDDYVFISYKSDNYERVLDDIVYKVCRKYGLRVYFDTAFDDDSDSWIMQYYDNMCDIKCKAFLAFLDDSYYSSYACLLEMMSRKTAAAGGDFKKDSLFFLPVNIGSISEILDGSNTGLGTRRYANGKINSHAEEELKKFNEIFSEVADDDPFMRKSLYKREHDTQVYDEATSDRPQYGKMYLSVTQCRTLMERVIPKKNDNDGSNKELVEVIHDKLLNNGLASVFGESGESNILVDPPMKGPVEPEKVTVRFRDGDEVQDVRVEKGHKLEAPARLPKDGLAFKGWYVCVPDAEGIQWDFQKDEVQSDIELYARWEPAAPSSGSILLADFLKKYDNNTFKKDTFGKFRLVGAAGYERYGTEFCGSAFDLAWGFVMKLLAERGEAFIRDVNERHPGLKNPVFINQDIYDGREDQNKYRKIQVEGLEGYYMYRHYGQYQWIDSVLKPRLLEFGLPMDQFSFEYLSGEGSGDGQKGSSNPDTGEEIGKGKRSVAETEDRGKEDGGAVGKGGTITGPQPLNTKKVIGRHQLAAFLAEFDNKNFQSKSCQQISLIGVNGCEKYSMERDADGKAFQSARQLVFQFAMKRLDEMGMAYIEAVNGDGNTKNPIFITQEEHRARKERKESVTYTAVASKAVSGYSMCTHYSEYDWLRNSLTKQLKALGLAQEDFYLELE